MSFMPKSKLRILILSSADPTRGPGVLATDYCVAFKQQGCEVDVLTLNKCDRYPDYLYVQNPASFIFRVTDKLRRVYRLINNRITAKIRGYSPEQKDVHYFSFDEEGGKYQSQNYMCDDESLNFSLENKLEENQFPEEYLINARNLIQKGKVEEAFIKNKQALQISKKNKDYIYFLNVLLIQYSDLVL